MIKHEYPEQKHQEPVEARLRPALGAWCAMLGVCQRSMLYRVSNSCKVGRLTPSSTSVRVMIAFILRLAYRRKDRLHLWTRTDHAPLRLMAQPLLQGAVLLFNLRVRGRQGSKYGEAARDGNRYTIFIVTVSSLIGIVAQIKVVASERYNSRQSIRSRNAGA
jgi:hypothetical protein